MSYSWGDDTNLTRNTGGFDYSSARRGYSNPTTTKAPTRKSNLGNIFDTSVNRTYGKTRKASVPDAKNDISTDSPYPLVIATDVTGSMGSWPETIFEKLPLLYTEVLRYLPGVEISFAAIGDAYSDSYPLQICEFGKEASLDAKLNSLYAEGNGGGQAKETYELAGYYYLNKCKIPNAKKPILIMTGDEGFYTSIDDRILKQVTGDSISENLSGKKVLQDLAQKFDTYLLRKQYNTGSNERDIMRQWQEALGPEKVIMLEDPKRIVDVMIGIVAGAVNEYDDFTTRLTTRQTATQVKQVMNTLKSAIGDATIAKRITDGSSSKKTKGLI